MRMTGNTILITGGTSGIGRSLAQAFHAKNNKVIVAGRREALLEELTARYPGMLALQLDVMDERSIDAFVAKVRDRFPALNVLINNAGISKSENYSTEPVDTATPAAIIRTNISSVVRLTAALLPALERQSDATLMVTSSGLAFVPMAAYPTYCASKAFIHSWTESLRFQLRDRVEVLELVPPYVQTELSGPQQATDPRAMPLADFVAEVMKILETRGTERGEILVEKVRQMRFAEKNGEYDQILAGMRSF